MQDQQPMPSYAQGVYYSFQAGGSSIGGPECGGLKEHEMARRAVRRARPPRYIWQNLRIPMAERRLALLLAFVMVMCSIVSIGDARTLAAPFLRQELARRTVPEEASAMLDLRTSLSLRDEGEWPELSDPCTTWTGVRCQEGHVVEVMLSGLNASQEGPKLSSSIDALQQLSHLRSLNVSGFSLWGSSLPVWLGGLVSLEVMDFMSASLTGCIPSSIGNLGSLRILRLANNSLTGAIPTTMGNLKRLASLDLSGNELQRRIPEALGNLGQLRELNLSLNRLQGMVPDQLGTLAHLTHLDLSSNSLVGSIPPDLGRLAHLRALLLSHNKLTGVLPSTLGKLQSLRTLDLSSNALSGQLPPQLWKLVQLESLNLSNNLLSFPLPDPIPSFNALTFLDLSGNHFSGDLRPISDLLMAFQSHRNCFPSPHRTLAQRSHTECSSLMMSLGLGTDPSALPTGPNHQKRMLLQSSSTGAPPNDNGGTKHRLVAILAGAFGVIALILLVAVVVFYVLQYERRTEAKRKEKLAATVPTSAATKSARKALNIPSGRSINVTRLGEEFSYAQLQLATGQFDLSNMIMAGHTGDLYKGVLNGTSHIVVKRIDVGRFRKDMYVSELEFLGRVSHARLVPLLGYCLEREDEKLLVYKYMPNGDLAYALHRTDSPSRPEEVLQSLDWITRLKIAIGVAEGLVYLHHDCSPPLVHRDIKASSILLDDKFEVRLGSLSDGRVQQGDNHSNIIGRILRLSRSSDQLDAGLPFASCSYDVFCFGKVLLELVSGKLGISGSIDPGADAWLDWALPLIDIHDREPLMKLMDPSLIVDEDLMEEVWATAIIAKSCLNPKASRRPNMKHILRALENPQKVVRDDHSGPMKSRHSSYGSWNSALFGGWRHFSSDSAFGFQGSLREEHSLELSRAQPTVPGEDARYQKRPGSREIVPVPLSGPKSGTLDSDETGS